MNLWWMKVQCLQDEGVDCSSHCVRAFVWGFEGFQRVFGVLIGELHWEPMEPSKSRTNAPIQPVKVHFISRLVIKRGLE